MARLVKISTLGPTPPRAVDHDPSTAVDCMIAFWQNRLDQVLPDRPDLIVLPECSDRFADWPAAKPPRYFDYYRARGDRVLDFLAQIAVRHRCHIAYPAYRELPDGSWRNSVQLIGPGGEVLGVYDKNCPTIGEVTERGIVPGAEATVIECALGRVGFAVCFDLNFTELLDRYARQKPDLMLFCSVYHGGLMQAYWAYACRAHLVSAVSRLPSQIISPVGQTLATTTNYTDHATATVNLDCRLVHLDYHWEKLAALKAEYGPGVRIHDPGHLGSVLVTSETGGLSIDQMLGVAGIQPLDAYLDRSRRYYADSEAAPAAARG